jgi:GNAT superfamily N-acetyltransferase/proteasome lid subunit RPN8/RPN11
MPAILPVSLVGRRRTLADQIDAIEEPKSLTQLIDEIPTQSATTDALKRTGRSLVDQPGAVVQAGGSLLDAMARFVRGWGAAQAVPAMAISQAFLPENEREKLELPAETIGREYRRPSEAAQVVQDTGRQMRADMAELYKGDFAPDPARDQTLAAKVADSSGSLAAAIATPGGVVAKTITGALLNSQGAADAAEQDLLRQGKSAAEAREEAGRQFVLNLPAGALESVAWGRLMGRYGRSVADAVAEKWGKTAAQRIVKAAVEQGAIEGGEEWLQNLVQNTAAKATYDPDRKLTEGGGDAALVGMVMGGGLASGLQSGAELAAPRAEVRQADDKIYRTAEEAEGRKPTLAAQIDAVQPEAPARREAPPATDAAPPEDLNSLIDRAAEDQQARATAAAQEEREREARQQRAREKREQFEFHLGNAQRLASGVEASGTPAVAEVSGVANVLRDYLADNALGLTLDQKQQARDLLGTLEPIEARLKDQADEAAAQRMAADKARREQEEAAQKARIAEERRALAAQKDLDPMTGRKRLDSMTEDELVAEAERGNKAALRLLEQRSVGDERDRRDDLLTVLKRVQLPASDPTMGSELEDLKREWANFGTRQQVFSTKPGSLDRVAEVLRTSHGFTAIQTPADVIEFTKRALRGEKILPDRLGGEEQTDFATAEPAIAPAAPVRPRWDENRGREQLADYVADVARFEKEMREFARTGPDMQVFRSRVQDNTFLLVSRNVREGEKPWRVTEFKYSPISEQMEPQAHTDYATKEEAVMDGGRYADYAPEVQFAREDVQALQEGQRPDQVKWHLSRNARDLIVRRGQAEIESGRAQIDNPLGAPEDVAKAYVEKNGTPPGKAAAAQADIAALVQASGQSELGLSYEGTGRRGRKAPDANTGRSVRAAAAIKDPNDPAALKAAFADGPTISSIIPELVRDPTKAWDIRGAVVRTAKDFAMLAQALRTPYVETCKIAFLDNENRVVHSEILTIGTTTSALLAPNSMARVLRNLKASTGRKRVIISHNHPSGDPAPSAADVQVTRQFRETADALGFELIDHVITNGDTFYSFQENGVISGKPARSQNGGKVPHVGPDVALGRELGTPAPWEVVKRGELPKINRPELLRNVANALRQVDPTAAHLLVVNRKNALLCLQRLTDFKTERPTTDALNRVVFEAMGREGGSSFLFILPEGIDGATEMRIMRDLRAFAKATDFELLDMIMPTTFPKGTPRESGVIEEKGAYEASAANEAAPQGGAAVEPMPAEPDAEPTLRDFENRLARIAPGLMLQYRVLVGGPEQLSQLGVRPEQLSGREQAAHNGRRKMLWFLSRNVRADKDGLMPERLRRDVLHETTHAWLDTLDRDTQEDLVARWREDVAAPDGWLAQTRKNKGVALRAGVEKDWKEYWAERIAQENNAWARRREAAVAFDRGVVGQLAYDFRTWLQEALEYLQQAFTRTRRYNVDFRAFLQDNRFPLRSGPEPLAGPGGAVPAPQPIAAAQGTLELGTPLGIQLPPTVKNLASKWQGKTLDFESSLDKALYYAGGEGNTEERGRLVALINDQTGLSNGQIATLARKLREKLRPLTDGVAAEGTLRVPPQMQSEVEELIGTMFAEAPQTLSELREKWASMGVQNFVSERDGIITLSELRVPPEKRNQGLGSQFMAELVAYADAKGYDLALTPSVDFGASSLERLKKFYRRFGLKDNKGRNKDFRTSEGMRRESKQVDFALDEEQDPAARRVALVRQLNELTKQIDAATNKGNLRRQRGLMGTRSEIRAQLESEFPDWRKLHPRGSDDLHRVDGPAAAPAPTPEGETVEPEPGAVPPPEREFAQRVGIYDEVEGHTTMRTPWLERTAEKIGETLRGIRGSIPELPAFADDRDQKYSRLRQFMKLIKRGTPRVWKEAADQVGDVVQPLLALGALDADVYARLGRLQARARQLREDGKPVPADITEEIGDINRKVMREPYGLFQKIALYLDLKWRVENLKDEQGNAIVQPAGINVDEINRRLDELKEALATNPHRAAIMNAIKEHQRIVKAIAEDLRRRDLTLPEDLQNPFYFPHVVLGKHRDALERVKLDTSEDFRGYLMKPVGSNRAIETDYAKAMYYHLVAVGSHNLRSDLVRDYLKPYDVMAEVKERAKELAKKYGRAVSWREAYATEYAKNGFALFHPDDRLPLHPEMTIDRDRLARRLGVALTEAPLQEQFAALGLRGIKILPEDIRETLGAGEQETWVLPETVAEALNGMLDRETRRRESLISRPIELAQKGWKLNILFAPWNYARYEFNNTTADLEKLLSADPAVFRLLPQAAREVRQFIEDGTGGRDVREAFKLGVLSSVTADELNDLAVLRQFERLKTQGDKLGDIAKGASALFLGGKRSTVDVSRLREATFRYAKFKADLDRLRNGARPVYAGAYWRDIDAIGDSAPGAGDANHHKAAEISLATFGDYHNISVLGQELRRYLIPFYSWMEINFRYHANLFRNLADMAAARDLSAAEAAAAGARAAGVMAASFTRRAAVGVLLRLALPYLAMVLWNSTGDREEIEDELSEEDRRRFHIIVGRDDKGRAQVIYGATALADVMKWFGGPAAAQLGMDVVTGRTGLGDAVGQWFARFPRDFANNLFQVGPVPKAAYTAMAQKSTFPDVTDQRTIPANEVKWAILSQMTDQFTADMIRRAADKDYLAPRDMKDWAMQAILQVRKRDAEQWAFYEIKDKAADYLEQKTGRSRDSQFNAPDQQVLRNFRRSIYRGDVENALRFYDRLIELGYTAERFAQSIRAQDPLSELPKDLRRGFVESLSPFERRQLDRAFSYYSRMSENRGDEKRLFPSERLSPAGRENYQPRHDRLREQLRTVETLTPEERRERALKELNRSLRPSR